MDNRAFEEGNDMHGVLEHGDIVLADVALSADKEIAKTDTEVSAQPIGFQDQVSPDTFHELPNRPPDNQQVTSRPRQFCIQSFASTSWHTFIRDMFPGQEAIERWKPISRIDH